MLSENSTKVQGLRRQFLILYIIAALSCVLAATVISLAFISAFDSEESSATADEENETEGENQSSGNNQTSGSNQNNNNNNSGSTNNNQNHNQNNNTGSDIPEGQVIWVEEPDLHLGTLILANDEYTCDPITYVSQSGNLRVVAVKPNRTTGTTNLWALNDSVKLSYDFIDALCKMADDLTAAGITERHLMVYSGFSSEDSIEESKTGLSVILRMILDGVNYQLDNSDAESVAVNQWILENCYRYGIILRYPGDKQGVTGESHSSRRFRYVGTVHATYMKENNYCLEEYLTQIRKYNFNKRLDITVDGSDYSLYYVTAGEYENGIPLPKDAEYEISADNTGGYVVMIKK